MEPDRGRIDAGTGVRSVFDSSEIPGEILDLCLVRTETLRRDPRLGRALVGTWYEVLKLMQDSGPSGREARAKMAELAGCSAAEFDAQLETTAMFWNPAAAVAHAESAELARDMEPVRRFCFAKKLWGEGVRSVNDVGIAYPDGTVQGNPAQVRLRFDTSFAKGVE